ncbi:MAG: ABC transporter permease [Lachnospiraceae bacterium]|nr:ABC transporter permease [Lachnospiraceae bacterium]
MSESHKQYLNLLHKQKRMIKFFRFLIFAIFLILWEVAANTELIDAFFFSSPSRIVNCIISMGKTGELFTHIGYTLAETILSFFFVMLLTIVFASILWFSKSLAAIFEPTLVILNSLPKSALAPLFIVWLGTGMKTIIVAGISVAIFGSVISLYTQFHQTDPEKEKLILTLGGNKWDIYSRIVFPYSLPTLINSMKVNIGLSLVGVVIGEFLAARQGLGYLIIYGTQVFKLDMVISSIIILCVIAYGLYFGIQKLEKKTEIL